MQTRSRAIYGNWTVLGPDGEFMFHSGDKKIEWYLNRGLATQLSGKLIKLNFEPNGPGCLDKYRRQQSVNQCVVCGVTDGLTLHHVVPYQYRKHLCASYPYYRRDFHDCLPLCIKCHKKYENCGRNINKQIAAEFNVPLDGVIDAPFSVVELQSFGRVARAIVDWGHKMPAARKAFLQERIREMTGTELELAYAKKEDFNYRTHGELVIEQVVENDEADDFVQLWRQHFLGTMKPECLPPHWEVQRPVFRTREHLDNYR